MTEIYWMQHHAFPLLAALQLVPLLGALVLHFWGEKPGAVSLGRLVALLELALAAMLYLQLDKGSAALQFAEYVHLVGPVAYHAAADGVTVLFVLLAALIVFLLSLYGLVRGLAEPGRLLTLTLAVEAVLMSMLVTLNLLWFALASALELALVGYLLWYWATSPEKDMALARFLQFQSTGLVMLLAGAFLAAWSYADVSGSGWSFDLLDLSRTGVGKPLGGVVFFLLFYGLAVRTPLFPFHGWLPLVAKHGNVAVGPTLLLGVKVGIYGMVRFLLPIVHDAVVQWHGFVVGFAVVGVFYAAFLAFLQADLRRLMAFAVVSHTSLIIIGLFTLHPAAFQGSVLLAVNFGLAATVMLFMTGFVYRRTRTTGLDRLGGLFDRIPFISMAYLIGGFSMIGMPGTPGFDAVHLLLEASIETFGATVSVVAALGNVITAGFLLWAFQRAFLAPRPAWRPVGTIEATQPMEYLVGGTVVAILLITGFYLEPWQKLIEPSLHALALRFGAH